MLVRPVNIMFLVMMSCSAFSSEINHASPDEEMVVKNINYCFFVKEIIAKQRLELARISSRKSINRNLYQVVNAFLFIVPYTLYYYQSYLNESVTNLLGYYLPPTSLATYFFTLPKSHDKSVALCDAIENDIKPLSSLLPEILRIFESIREKSTTSMSQEDVTSLHKYLMNLPIESQPIFNFIVDVLRVAADKYRHSPEMMSQELAGDLPLRIILLYSLLTLLDQVSDRLDLVTDKKPTINLVVMETWNMMYYSYKVLVERCADELHKNLPILKESHEQLSTRQTRLIGLRHMLMGLLKEANGKS